LGEPAPPVVFRGPALRGGTRSALARSLGRATDHRDRSNQGNRGGLGQGPPSWSQAGRRRGRRRGGGGRGSLTARLFCQVEQSPAKRPGFYYAHRRASLTLSCTRRNTPEECPGTAIITLALQRRCSPTWGSERVGGHAGAI